MSRPGCFFGGWTAHVVAVTWFANHSQGLSQPVIPPGSQYLLPGIVFGW
ncbi:MAG: hypothetical protein ACKO3P_06355 [Planctomycetaceae bacterium]